MRVRIPGDNILRGVLAVNGQFLAVCLPSDVRELGASYKTTTVIVQLGENEG